MTVQRNHKLLVLLSDIELDKLRVRIQDAPDSIFVSDETHLGQIKGCCRRIVILSQN